MSHSEEMIKRVRGLAAQKLSAAKIGAEVSLSRCAVIGLCRRRGIVLMGNGGGQRRGGARPGAGRPRRVEPVVTLPALSTQSVVSEAVEKPRPDRIVELRPRPRIALPPRPIIPDDQRTDLIGILALNGSTCRWPIGERPIMFCGHETVEGKSYCAHHQARSIRKREVGE